MSTSKARLLTAVAAVALAMTGFGAEAVEARGGERYALVDPAAFERGMPAAKAPSTSTVVRKKAKAGKAKILNGLNSFRTPARLALDRIEHANSGCQAAGHACPAVFRSNPERSQPWRHANLLPSAEAIANSATSDAPPEGQSALLRPNNDVLGLVPGRESNYRVSLNLPLGRYENVLLQANVRKNAYNAQAGNDSTLRADWSTRF